MNRQNLGIREFFFFFNFCNFKDANIKRINL